MSRSTAPPSSSHSDVVYFADDSITRIVYAKGHPMRPVRVRLLHSLVQTLGLDKYMRVCSHRPADSSELLAFHTAEYVHFLQSAANICAHPEDDVSLELQREFHAHYSADSDCPIFPQIWSVVRSFCGGSIACARVLRGRSGPV